MRTTFRVSLAALIVLGLSSVSSADEKSHRMAAEELLKLMNTERQMTTAIDQMLDLQVKSNPAMAPMKGVMKKFFNKHMSWDSLKEDLITIYADAFTEEELKQIQAFYRTPAGKKMIAKMPELTTKGMQLGMKRVQDNQAELIQMLRDEQSK